MATRYIDLSIEYGGELWSQPFLFDMPRIEPIHNHAEHGRSNTFFATSCHIGTHIDAPFHFVDGGAFIDDLDVSTFLGDALLIDLRSVSQEGAAISGDQIAAALGDRDLRGKIGVLRTGWGERMYGTEDYSSPRHPYYTKEAAEWLVANAPKALVVDTVVDPVEPPRPGDNPVHRTVLGAGIPLIENVLNLGMLPSDGFRILALPLRIARADGAPARVIAEVDVDG